MAIAGDEITLTGALEPSLHLRGLDQYNMIGPMPLGAVTVADLPLQPLQIHAVALKHFFDIIMDCDGAVDHNQLRPIVRDRAWGELPAPFSLPAPAPFNYKMQLFILPQVDGKYCIVKHYYVASVAILAQAISSKQIESKRKVPFANKKTKNSNMKKDKDEEEYGEVEEEEAGEEDKEEEGEEEEEEEDRPASSIRRQRKGRLWLATWSEGTGACAPPTPEEGEACKEVEGGLEGGRMGVPGK